MKNKLILILLLVISILCLVSCNEEKEDDLVETYTITWVNDDETILEIDYDVVKGAMPEYNGSTPISSKESPAIYSYVFNGWSPEVLEVTNDAVYTATYMKLNLSTTVFGSKPIVSEDKKTVIYGLYPQS